MAKWTTGFEAVPTGGSFGSLTAVATLGAKTEFKARFEQEHTWVDAASPECIHLPGQCRVCGLLSGTPGTNLVIGALQYDYDGEELYRDNGASMEGIGGLGHGSLDGLSDDDHVAYLRVAVEETITDVEMGSTRLDGLLIDYKVMNLDETAGDYAGNLGYVMPRVLHMGTDAAGGSKHDADVIDDESQLGVNWGVDRLTATLVTHEDDSPVAGATYYDTDFGRYAFMPYVDEGTHDGYLQVCATVVAAWSGDYNGGFTFYLDADGTERVLIKGYKLG